MGGVTTLRIPFGYSERLDTYIARSLILQFMSLDSISIFERSTFGSVPLLIQSKSRNIL